MRAWVLDDIADGVGIGVEERRDYGFERQVNRVRNGRHGDRLRLKRGVHAELTERQMM
jgi:hypothetical protein